MLRRHYYSNVCHRLKPCECGCGEDIFAINNMGYLGRFRPSHNSKAENNPNWGGGKAKNSYGYNMIKGYDHPNKNRDNYILEHRLIWEKCNKACLLPWSIVHHINENKTDNNPENLKAMMRYQHPTIHKG